MPRPAEHPAPSFVPMFMEALWRDVKFGVKLLLRERGFTLTALLTLALCIGANTAVFTVFRSVLLRPLPYPQPDRLVTMYNVYPGVGVHRGANGIPDYLDRRQEREVFEDVALFGSSGYDVGADGAPQRLFGIYATPSLFRLLRVPPLLGRAFTEEEAALGKEKVVLLSYGLWQQMFAGDRSVMGRDLRLSGAPYKIVGVMPASFEFGSRGTQLWVPFAFTPQQTSDEARHSNAWGMVARLKPGVSLSQAQQRIDALNRRNLERFPKYRKLLEEARFGTRVQGLQDAMVEDIRPTLYLLQAVVAFVLLIGCVNVANLLLVRSNVRRKELAVRYSLGASRGTLGRQLLTESVLLALAGGALGILIGFWGARLLSHLGAEELPRGHTIHPDGTVLSFALLVAVAAGLLFGSIPVWHLFRRNLSDVFRQTERTGTAERGALRTRAAMVICQVSLAFVLLIGAGLVTLSFLRALRVDPGFRPDGVLTARISLPRSRYADEAPARGFFDRLLESARALPRLARVGLTSYLPFGGSTNSSAITIEGYSRAPGEPVPVPGFNTVDSDYFRVMGIPLLRGRAFQPSDTTESLKVVIIDQFLARRYWPDKDPIGAKIRRGVDPGSPLFTVVGVVGSVKVADLTEQNPVGVLYFYYRQVPSRSVHLVMSAGGDPAAPFNAVRRETAKLDPELPLYDIKSMKERLERSLLSRRAAMVLCLVFAGLALLLAAIGIYGLLAYAVTQRTREFGIRIALGARAADVLAMVFHQGLTLALVGVAIGVAGAYWLTRLMSSLLFEVKPADPAVFLLGAVTLSAVAAGASLLPSLRATAIDPVVALRYE